MDRKIAEDASRWLLVLKNASPVERREFVAWVRQSPEHLQEFLAVSAISDHLATCNWEAMPELDELIRSLPENVIPFPSGHSVAGKPVAVGVASELSAVPEHRYARRWVAAAACVMGAVGALWIYEAKDDKVYETDVGEQRTVQLADGSVMSINTRSKAVFTMTEEGRYVALDGEAAFTVAHDPSRPFQVKSGEVVVTAIGTQFNVRGYPSGTTVSVLEGTVGIAAAGTDSTSGTVRRNAGTAEAPAADYSVILTAGKEAHLDRSGTVRTVVPNPDDILSWQQRLLVFRGHTLEDMIAEFNRWNHRQIRVVGHIDSDRRYDGVFSASDIEALLDFLALDDSITLEATADEIILRPRTP